MAHIDLGVDETAFPGIQGLLRYRPETARPLMMLAEVLLRLDATTLMVTHDLPFALQLCPRSIVLDDGAVVADGPTRELLADEELLRRHRLELPYGFVLS